jgi:protein-S-isoprenylcysteine O-methyltransferase Ste14
MPRPGPAARGAAAPPASRHLRAILLLPGTVTVVVPAVLAGATRATAIGWDLPMPLALVPPLAGAALMALGLTLVVRTIALFATVGEGTLAPWDPTRHLVVRGVYRHVRNPMISGVLCVLLGEATALGSRPLVCWFLVFFAANAVYIPLSEERGLLARFGDEYRIYRAHVPRWLPRRTPWEGGAERDAEIAERR